MRAALLKKFGNSSEFYIGKTTIPSITKDQVLIENKYSAVNRADIMQRQGAYPPPKGASDILGLECSGIIKELGDEAKNEGKWKVGDKVMCLLSGGGYAEYSTVHKGSILSIPNNFSFEQAAAIPEVFLTTFQTIVEIGGLKEGQNVLIHAGASGVGTAAIQLSKALNCKNIITTSSSKKVEICKKYGATLALDYQKNENWDEIISKTCPEGVSVILDPVGANYFEKNCKVLGLDGKIVYIAMMSGAIVKDFDLRSLFRKRGTITFSTLRSRTEEYKEDLVSKFTSQFYEKLENGQIEPVIDSIYNLDEIKEAHDKCESSQNAGKIILKI